MAQTDIGTRRTTPSTPARLRRKNSGEWPDLLFNFQPFFVPETGWQPVSPQIPRHTNASGPNELPIRIQIWRIHPVGIHVRDMFVLQFVRSVVILDYGVEELAKQGVRFFLGRVNATAGVELLHSRVYLVEQRGASFGLLVFKLVEYILSQVFLQQRLYLGTVQCFWEL